MRNHSTTIYIIIFLFLIIRIVGLENQLEESRDDFIKLEIEYQRLEHTSQYYHEQWYIEMSEQYAAYDEARQISATQDASYYSQQ